MAACGDDDDDDSSDTGGSSTAGRSGSSNGSGNANSAGDADFGGNPSLPGTGGTRTGGTGGTGGTRTGGTGSTAAGNGGTRMGPSAGGADATAGGAAGAGAAAGAAEPGGAGGEAAQQLADAEILLVLDTLNQGEVEEAYAALPRLADADVRDFAQLMVTDHGSARQSVAATADDLNINPMPSAVQRRLMAEGEAHVEELRSTPTANLDSTYVNLEVEGHREALALLNDLADAADAAELKSLIATLEATVQDHYDQAVDLQDQL